MKRTQLYLDDQLWEALHATARSQKTTVSELVRVAARDKYVGSQEQRLRIMRAFIGSRKRTDNGMKAVDEVRALRRGNRLERLNQK